MLDNRVYNCFRWPSVNARKNIPVVTRVMDRSLCTTVLRALIFEWSNPNCCVPVPRALTGDCIFRSVKSSQWGDDKKTKNMGMDISRRKYMICAAEDRNQTVSRPTDVSFSGGIKELTAIHGSRYRQNHANC